MALGKWMWRYCVIIFWIFFFVSVCRGASQQDVVAMTILGEARGEGKAGMYAVATVINQRAINRNKTPGFIRFGIKYLVAGLLQSN